MKLYKPSFLSAIIYVCYLTLTACSFIAYANDNQKQLTLATTQWCPYTCVSQGDKGNLIGKYLSDILAKHNIHLSVQSYPWARAVRLAENKTVDGLLTATHAEAPNLSFTENPIANFQVCFYSHQASHWRYQSPLRLNNLTLGVIKGYGYQKEIDDYVTLHQSSEKIISLSGDQGLLRLIAMLKKQRVDVIVADKMVLNWQAKSNRLDLTDIRNVGCTAAQPFYLALNSDLPELQTFLNILNNEFVLSENQQKLEKLIEQYSF